MKKLNKKEWVAVCVAIFVVGFFFVFGQTFMSIFSKTSADNLNTLSQAAKLIRQDQSVGTGEEAQSGDLIVINYTGRLVDGTVFDSTLTRGEPYQFVLGSGSVIKGWDLGIVGMRVGGKRILSIPPEYGYGFMDRGNIPGGSTLIYEIELLRVTNQ